MVEWEEPVECLRGKSKQEAQQCFSKEMEEYVKHIKEVVGKRDFQFRVSQQSKTVNHVLAFTCLGDCSELIKKIKHEFPDLPIYCYRQNGVNCLVAGIDISELTGFVKGKDSGISNRTPKDIRQSVLISWALMQTYQLSNEADIDQLYLYGILTIVVAALNNNYAVIMSLINQSVFSINSA